VPSDEVDEALINAAMAVSRSLVAITVRSISSAPVEITVPQFRALVLLEERQPMTMAEIATELGLSPSSCTRLVERLERKSFVSRQPSSVSRRNVDVRLEPAGDALVASVMFHRRRELIRLLADIEESKVASVQEAFAIVARLAGEAIDVNSSIAGTDPESAAD